MYTLQTPLHAPSVTAHAPRGLSSRPPFHFLTMALFAAAMAISAVGPLRAQSVAPASAQRPTPPTVLSPVASRLSDDVIHADHGRYAALQARLKGLNDGGRPLADYHLAKAQCWLDVSFHEYTRNDRSAFPQAAMTESERLVLGMEAKHSTAQLGFDTPLVNDATKLRPDLWTRLGVLKQHQGFRCAQQKIACAEVELVHAGNEFKQQQWRHAKPYVQIAEELIAEAQVLSEACVVPKAGSPVAGTAAATIPLAAMPTVTTLPTAAVIGSPTPFALSANVLFNFDKRDAANIRAASMQGLNELMIKTSKPGMEIERVTVTGHADRLNGTGSSTYNVALARDRAETVKKLLQEKGVTANLIVVDAQADAQPVATCDVKRLSAAALQECLLPNRRVEVRVLGMQRKPLP